MPLSLVEFEILIVKDTVIIDEDRQIQKMWLPETPMRFCPPLEMSYEG